MTTSYGQLQAGKGFYAIGKDMLQALGATKSIIISILADLDDLAQKQGYDRFFATSQSLAEKTGYSQRTIQRAFDELKADGIIDDGVKGEGLDNRKYYKLDYERTGKIIAEKLPQTAKDAPDDKGKNTPNDYDKMSQTIMTKCHKPLRQNVINDYDKNSSAFMTNCHKPTYTTNLNLQEQNLQVGEQKPKTQKVDFKKAQFLSAEECLDFVKKGYEKLETKPKGDFSVFCEWLVRKADKKGLLPYVLKRDFENYQKLDFLTKESPNDRLNRALQGNARGVYQSLVFENDVFMAGGYKPQGLQHNSHNVNENFKITDGQKELFENTSKRAMINNNVKIHKLTIKGFKEAENERQATE
jgi:DNA-binding transcriptional ArsR family regulator